MKMLLKNVHIKLLIVPVDFMVVVMCLRKKTTFGSLVLAVNPQFYLLHYFPLMFSQLILIEKHKIHGLTSIMFKVLDHYKIKNVDLTLLIISLSLSVFQHIACIINI